MRNAKGKRRESCALAGLFCLFQAVGAAQPMDVPGSSDHEAVSRYKGSILLFYDEADYDSYVLPLGLWDRSTRAFKPSQTVEGKVTRRSYVAPEGTTQLTAYRNFENAARSSGLKVLFSCMLQECGPGFAAQLFTTMPQRLRPKAHYHNFHALPEFGYIAAEGQHKGRQVWVSIGMGVVRAAGSHYRDANNRFQRFSMDRLVFFVDTIESAKMATGMVSVTLDKLNQGIANEGKVTLDGIFFDTDKSVLKPESDPALGLIAGYMKSNPAFRFFVTGHTDATGSYEHNLQLSDARAKAVVQSLIEQHGIAASRLVAVGVGPVAPVAANDSEDGRAKNRRVELVKMGG